MVLQVLCCETQSCHAHCHHNLVGEALEVLFSLFCAWNITTVEINSGVHLLNSKIRQVPLFTYRPTVVMVLLFWSWSQEFGLVLYAIVRRLYWRQRADEFWRPPQGTHGSPLVVRHGRPQEDPLAVHYFCVF